ncbi:hypothetical protein AVMA1855_17920 [Acidovorax sp. SUPP1855]|nr:hypothetical protein AVMA1855_17920 [Acidovorax sp. SUPP1855]
MLAPAPPNALLGAASHFHEHHRSIAIPHDQIDLAAATPGRSIIALDQPQSSGLQVGQREVFGSIADHARGGHRFFPKESH